MTKSQSRPVGTPPAEQAAYICLTGMRHGLHVACGAKSLAMRQGRTEDADYWTTVIAEIRRMKSDYVAQMRDA